MTDVWNAVTAGMIDRSNGEIATQALSRWRRAGPVSYTHLVRGEDLALINENKGWYREGAHGREVKVGDIMVEKVPPMEGDKKEMCIRDSLWVG